MSNLYEAFSKYVIVFFFIPIICFSGCLTSSESHGSGIGQIVNESDNASHEIHDITPTPITTPPSEGTSFRTFREERFSFQYPATYTIVDPATYRDEEKQYQASILPVKILIKLQSEENQCTITVKQHLPPKSSYYEFRTVEGIYNYIINEMAIAKINEQRTGNWTSQFRGVRKILSHNLHSYIVEATTADFSLVDPVTKGEKIREGEWISPGNGKNYYIPWDKDTIYEISFYYPNTPYAAADEENRLAIIDSIMID